MRSVVKRNVHFLGISRFSHSLLLVLLSPVVQFSMINSLSRTHSRAHSLGIIPHLIHFVKRFFKSFLKNFFNRFQRAEVLFIIPQPVPFVKRFFKTFLKFLEVFFPSRRPQVSFIPPKRIAESLTIIAHRIEFVKRQKHFFVCAF